MAMSGSSSSFCAITEQAITQPENRGHLEVIQGQQTRGHQLFVRCYRYHFEVFQTLTVQ